MENVTTRKYRAGIRDVLRFAIYLRDGEACVYCARPVVPGAVGPMGAELDHLVPWGRGGSDHADNLVTACRACNRRRGNRPWLVFADHAAKVRIVAATERPLDRAAARAYLHLPPDGRRKVAAG